MCCTTGRKAGSADHWTVRPVRIDESCVTLAGGLTNFGASSRSER